jgi:uncharacterized protein YggE
MKYILQFFLLLLPVGFACCAFGADGTFDQPHIIVFGSAETERVPDELRWVLTVKTERPTAAEAAQAHVAEVTSVLTLLSELGLNKDEVETTNMQLKENWVYRNNNREQKGFFGLTGINFTTRDFARYVEFWSKLSSLDNVSISGVSFALSNKAEIEGQVKIKALQNGREKAVSLAAALGAEIAGPLLIEEFDDGGYFPPGPVRAMSMESDGGGGQPVSPGKERVAARMKLVFGLKMK